MSSHLSHEANEYLQWSYLNTSSAPNIGLNLADFYII